MPKWQQEYGEVKRDWKCDKDTLIFCCIRSNRKLSFYAEAYKNRAFKISQVSAYKVNLTFNALN